MHTEKRITENSDRFFRSLFIYIKTQTKDFFGINPKISAIHAGLECGVFASKIEGLTAISVGPQMYDVHTANERLSISSTEKFVELLINVLANIG